MNLVFFRTDFVSVVFPVFGIFPLREFNKRGVLANSKNEKPKNVFTRTRAHHRDPKKTKMYGERNTFWWARARSPTVPPDRASGDSSNHEKYAMHREYLEE